MVLKKIGPAAAVKEKLQRIEELKEKRPPAIEVKNIELTNDNIKSDLFTPQVRSSA